MLIINSTMVLGINVPDAMITKYEAMPTFEKITRDMEPFGKDEAGKMTRRRHSINRCHDSKARR